MKCGYLWTGRGGGEPRQCPGCWGRSFVSDEEARLASKALAPLGHLWLGRLPPLPNPGTVLAGPAAAVTLLRVMGRMKTQEERRQAAELLLMASDEFEENVVRELAARMYP